MAAAQAPIAAAPTDPLAYIQAVNSVVQLAAPTLPGSSAGWLHLWDASSGNLLRQYSLPLVDALAPQLILTYNSAAQPVGGLLGNY